MEFSEANSFITHALLMREGSSYPDFWSGYIEGLKARVGVEKDIDLKGFNEAYRQGFKHGNAGVHPFELSA